MATETIYKEIDTFVAGQKLTGSFRMIGRVTNARDALYGFIQLERVVEATGFTLTTGNTQCNCYLSTDGATHPIPANASAGLTGISRNTLVLSLPLASAASAAGQIGYAELTGVTIIFT